MPWPTQRAARLALIFLSFLAAAACQERTSAREGFTALERGLELGEFRVPNAAERGDAVVRAVRIDPALFALELANASAPSQGVSRTAREWCDSLGFVAAINAGLFAADNSTAVSLMRTREHVNNPRLTRDNAVLAFDPLEAGLPLVQIIDREHQDYDALKDRYGTLVQSIRMISFTGENMWAAQPRRHSVAAVGIDGKGRVLLLHARTPVSVHDLVAGLLDLPLGLRNAMYLEGGPAAQLYLRGPARAYEFVGLPEMVLFDEGQAIPAPPIPNVLGIRHRPRS